MGLPRILRKNIEKNQAPKPLIIFYPDVDKAQDMANKLNYIYNGSIPIMVVTDPKIYTRVKDGVEHSIDTKQHAIVTPETTNDKPE